MIAQEEAFVVGMQGRIQEQAYETEVTHFLKAAIGGDNVSGHNIETAACHFLT